MAWQAVTIALPSERQLVEVYSPEIPQDIVVCLFRAGKFEPTNPHLHHLWELGQFTFAPVYWRLVELPIVKSVLPNFQFSIGQRVRLAVIADCFSTELKKKGVGAVATVKKNAVIEQHEPPACYLEFDESDCFYGQYWVGQQYLEPEPNERN